MEAFDSCSNQPSAIFGFQLDPMFLKSPFDSISLSSNTGLDTYPHTAQTFPHSQQPLVGVIDTGFGANAHGTQVAEAIAHSNLLTPNLRFQPPFAQTPYWLGDGVGTGQWADSLTNFVDAAKASGQPHAVVNLSFDLTQINPDGSVTTRHELTEKEQAALTYAHDNGVLIVASSGNQNGEISALGQASQEFDNIITVGAADGRQKADYSSYGKGLDLLAPGSMGGSSLTGTSLAAAEVTATVAQMWAANPHLTEPEVIKIVESTASDLNTSGWDEQTGFGLLDTPKAVNLAQKTQPETNAFSELQLQYTIPLWKNTDGAIASERPDRPPHKVVAGDTLWDIAQKELGSGTRWHELRKADGSPFTPEEALHLQIGSLVYFPDSFPTGSNTPSGSSTPTQTQPQQPATPISVPENPQTGSTTPSGSSTTTQAQPQQPTTPVSISETPQTDANTTTGSFTTTQTQPQQPTTPVSISETPQTGSTTPTGSSTTTQTGQPPTVQTGQQQAYIVQPGDTLWGIAQMKLGDGTRWHELHKTDGSPFTPEEALHLQIGTSVYLPENSPANSGLSTGSSATTQVRQQQPYVVQKGDTLMGIAKSELGNSSRWHELHKADGSAFTAADARHLQVGTLVYFPESSQSGSGTATLFSPTAQMGLLAPLTPCQGIQITSTSTQHQAIEANFQQSHPFAEAEFVIPGASRNPPKQGQAQQDGHADIVDRDPYVHSWDYNEVYEIEPREEILQGLGELQHYIGAAKQNCNHVGEVWKPGTSHYSAVIPWTDSNGNPLRLFAYTEPELPGLILYQKLTNQDPVPVYSPVGVPFRIGDEVYTLHYMVRQGTGSQQRPQPQPVFQPQPQPSLPAVRTGIQHAPGHEPVAFSPDDNPGLVTNSPPPRSRTPQPAAPDIWKEVGDFIHQVVQRGADAQAAAHSFVVQHPEAVPLLLTGATVIVVATLGEDIVTGGLGILDDAPSFAVAYALAQAAIAA